MYCRQMSSAAIVQDHVEEEKRRGGSNCKYEDAASEDGVNQGKDVEHWHEDDDDSDLNSEDQSSSGFIIFNFPPPAPPPGGSKIVRAASVPCSPTSSSQSDMVVTKSLMKRGYRDHTSLPSIKTRLCRQPSEAMTQLASDIRFSRSKSCNDGRSSAPPDDFDLCPRCCIPCDGESGADDDPKEDDADHDSNGSADHEVLDHMKKHSSNSNEGYREEQRFKCGGSFCVSIPRLSKGKGVCFRRHRKKERLGGDAVSRIVSLEKFECESWASSALKDAAEEGEVDEDEEDDDMYYDLPLEKIAEMANDTNSPVKATFVFESARKGVLKRQSSKLPTRSSTSRHVRFLTPSQVSQPPSPSRLVEEPPANKMEEDLNVHLQEALD